MNLPCNKFKNYPEGKEDNTHLQYEGAVTFAGLVATELGKLGGIYAELLLLQEQEQEDPNLLRD